MFTEHNTGLIRKRDRSLSFADLLPYGFMAAPGILALKDGCLMGGFRYAGPDLNSSSEDELNALNERVNAILCRFDAGFMFHINLVRRPSIEYPSGQFPDPTTQLIEDERHLRYSDGNHSENETYFTLTWRPPSEKEVKFAAVFQYVPKRGEAYRWENNIDSFRARLDNLAEALRSLFGRSSITLLDDAGLLSHIESCIVGAPVFVHAPGDSDLDHYVGRHALVAGFKPSIDDQHFRVIEPFGFPSETFPKVTTRLQELTFPYRWVMRFIPLDPFEAVKALGPIRRHWFQRKLGGKQFLVNAAGAEGESPRTNAHALNMVADADAAIGEAHEGAVRFGFFTMAIIVNHADPEIADERAKAVQQFLGQCHFQSRIEDMNAVEALLGSYPGDGHRNVRRPILASTNVADIMPTTSIWAGEPENPCPMYPAHTPPLLTASASGLTPFRLNLHVQDVGHTIIVGPTGAGKSTLLGLMLAQFRRVPGAQVFWFDKGFSSYPLTEAVGGTHWSLGEDALKAAPLIGIDDDREFEWAQTFVEHLLRLNKVVPTPEQRIKLGDAMRLIAQMPRHMRSLGALANAIQDRELRAGLAPFTLPDRRAKYLDASEDVALESSWITFEMEGLIGLNELTTIPMLLYLFHRIYQRLDGRPTLIALDELPTYLSNPIFAEAIIDWVLTLRKKNAAVILSTPTIAGLAKSADFNTLIESCPTKIFLPNADASGASAPIYELFGLTPWQRSVVASAQPKQDYYYSSPLGKRLFDLNIDPATLAFVGSGSKTDLTAIRTLKETHGSKWPTEWLRSRGLNSWADYWLKLSEAM